MLSGYKASKKEQRMARNIKTRFSKGVLRPQEKRDLKENKDVVISIADPSPERSLDALRSTAGAWKETPDPEALKQAIYSDRLATSRPSVKVR